MDIDLSGLVLPERVQMVDSSADGRFAEFVIQPLERGYGHTLGNSVRRVLLSSLPGAAVWGFRIDGVVHEHQTIPGVVEDVHQVIQNLKSLVLMLDDPDGEVVLTGQLKKAGVLKAGDLKVPSTAQVLDPEHVILTLEEDRELNVEFSANRGRGFVLADQHELPKGSPVDLVRIDAVYNPVRRANFSVQETRVGQRTDFDLLRLEVETDGSVTPDEAVAQAAELVRRHLEYMLYFGQGGMPRTAPKGTVAVPERLQDLFARPIEDLAELSVRSRNSLQKENIRTLGELVQKTEDEMLGIENFGKKSLKEIADFLEQHSLHFGMQLKEGEDGALFFVDESAAKSTLGAGEG